MLVDKASLSVFRISACVAMGLLAICWNPAAALAQQKPPAVVDFLEENCTACHDGTTQEGDLDLEALSLELTNPDVFHRWERVFDRLKAGEMPPDDPLEPSVLKPFLNGLGSKLHTSDAARIRKTGRVSARRLTRSQYERNVCELLAIDIPLQVYLPEDPLTDGFDTVAKGQQISDHLMAAYLEAADRALDVAFSRILTPPEPINKRLDWEQLQRPEKNPNREPEGRPNKRDVVAWASTVNFYGRMHNTVVPDAGRYRIKLRISAVNPPKTGTVWCSLHSGVCNAKASTLYWIGNLEATDKQTDHEFVAWLEKDHQLKLVPSDSSLKKAYNKQGKGEGTVEGPSGFIEKMGVAGVAIKWIEMERLEGPTDDREARRTLIGDLDLKQLPSSSRNTNSGKSSKNKKQRDKKQSDPPPKQFEIVTNNPQLDLQRLIQSFAQRAFRHDVTLDEVQPYVEFARQRWQEEKSFQVGLRAGYRAVLCSSRFLFLQEIPGPLDDYALAARLSHFLTGSMPDEELMKLAKAGKLTDASVLRQQTDRLLDGELSDRAIDEFTDQWLMLYEIDFTTPDQKLYPEYDDILHYSLLEETHSFVRELIKQDKPVTNVIDSDFTYVNSRLARHYDIDWSGGTGTQRINLRKNQTRGGIITQASVLKVTANGTTTSPIIRGVWMLERILGQHIPPPPANVSAVEPDIRGATSIRDQIEKHKDIESCATCHVKIDPPGFALEHYDVIGGFRTRYRAVKNGKGKGKKWVDGLAIDASHELPPSPDLPAGRAFKDIRDLKKILIRQPQPLARSMASQFVTYATGAAPTFADRAAIDAIVDSSKSKTYGVRTILHEVVQSPLFRNK